jgi:crotonobetainyl-CoA:carnitine CoA-transferase CaiB-like acyl-CoA transferase
MPYHTLDSLMDDPHLKDVGFFQAHEHPTEGTLIDMKQPNRVSADARRDFLPAPKIGQHSVEILRQIGYGQSDIEAMIADRTTLDGRIGNQQRGEQTTIQEDTQHG